MARPGIFITKVKQKKDRNGKTYLIGSLGMATIYITPNKNNPDEWNFMLLENNRQQNQQGANNEQQRNQYQGGGTGESYSDEPGPDYDGEIPF